ncbi:DUF4352 domain-containing protein [Rhodococcus sp. NPDC049939]|uniref:DUF4352 domain-containing protein n=1 Tax=Rhodococcus sp. NPDC049939 TaxID=3155511 RepID=UPI003400DDEC
MTSPNPYSPQHHSSYGEAPSMEGQPTAHHGYSQHPQPVKSTRTGLYLGLGAFVVLTVLLGLRITGGFDFFGDSIQVTQNGSPAPSDVDFTGRQADDIGAPIGATVERGGVSITVGPIETRTGGYRDSEQFLCAEITVTNDGDESVRVPSSLDFQLQDPAGFGRSSSFGSGIEELESGQIAAGGSPVSGPVCFDDPEQSGEYVVLGNHLFGYLNKNRIGWVTER